MKTEPNAEQMQILLAGLPCARRRKLKPIRPARARWWFERMRRVVDAASEPTRGPTTAPKLGATQTPPAAFPSSEREAA